MAFLYYSYPSNKALHRKPHRDDFGDWRYSLDFAVGGREATPAPAILRVNRADLPLSAPARSGHEGLSADFD